MDETKGLFLTVREAAVTSGFSRARIRALCRAGPRNGGLPSVSWGGKLFIPRQALAEFAAAVAGGHICGKVMGA